MKSLTVLLLIPLSILILCKYCPGKDMKQMQVRIPYESKTELTQILKLNPDIIRSGDRYFEIAASEEFLDSLQALGYEPEIIHEDLTAFYLSGLDPTLDMGGYKTLAELNAYLDGIIADHPDIVSAKLNLGETIEGRSMWAVKISDNPNIEENNEL